ncbi:MAG: CAP domain-containing protein [Myxococcaceae bacterium]
MAALGLACVSAPTIKTEAEKASHGEFPERSALEDLKKSPPPPALFDEKSVEPESWTSLGKLSPEERAALEQSPWEQEVIKRASQHAGLVAVTPEAECYAREYAKFAQVYRAIPSRQLGDFLSGRCGMVDQQIYTRILFGDVGERSDADIWGEWHGDFEKMLEDDYFNGVRTVAAAYVRDGDKVGIAFISAVRKAYLTETPKVAGDGTVVLSGQILDPTDRIYATANKGELGYVECSQDEGVQLPQFRVRCALDPKDALTRVDIASFPVGRILGNTVADVWLSPDGSEPKQWHRPTIAALAGTAEGADVQQQLAAAVNAVRAKAGLPPMEIDQDESKTATGIAPYYFGAVTGNLNEAYADLIALGLMAGYDVKAVISHGLFAAGWARGDKSVASLIADAVAEPSRRAVLLDPAARRVAVGAIEDKDHKGVGAVFATYRVFEPTEITAEATKVRMELEKARNERGLPPVLPLTAAEEPTASALASVARGDLNAADALESAMSSTVARANKGVRGWRYVTSDLEKIDWPKEILQGVPQVHIDVTHMKGDKEHPWGRYLIFILIAEGTPQGTTA